MVALDNKINKSQATKRAMEKNKVNSGESELNKEDSGKIIISDKGKWAQISNINLDKYLTYFESVSLRDKIFFTKNLGVMIKAGLSLGQALKALAEQTPNKKFKKVLDEIKNNVNKGNSFAESLKAYPKIFNHLFVSMIAIGETSGRLENVLEQLHKQMTRDHALISKVRGAMIYPAVVITAMFGIGTAMLIFVIPKFVAVFKEVNAELPWATRALIKTSNIINQHGISVTLFSVIFIIILVKSAKTKKGKIALHKLFIKLPILAPIIKKINLARFARTMSSLLKTNIPIVEAFKITANVVGNYNYKNALLDTAEKIKKGAEINICLKKYQKIFPPTVTQMISVGEESGSLDSILEELATFYEDDVDQTMKNLPTIIEPVLMLLLGLGVAGMAMAVMMPMYSLSQSI